MAGGGGATPGGGEKKRQRANNVVPVHIADILGFTEETFRVEGTEAGMVVMTGSSITTRFPQAGEHYRFAVDGLGEVLIDWRE